MALLCDGDSKVLTCGLLEPPKLFSVNEFTTTSDDDGHQRSSVAPPSSIYLSNADDDFAPPTSILEVSYRISS